MGRNIIKKVSQNHNIIKIGREPNDDIYFDFLSGNFKIKSKLNNLEFDVFFHLAGKAHDFEKKNEHDYNLINYENFKKLINLLDLSKIKFSNIIYFSSVSVYGLESGEEIDESHALNAVDSYGASKINAEKFLIDYSQNQKINLLILRLPLVIGKNAPGNLKRMLEYLKLNKFFLLNGGKARKSMVYINDISNNIENWVSKNGIYNLTDNYNPSFKEFTYKYCDINKLKLPKNIPFPLSVIISLIGNIINSFVSFPLNIQIYRKLTKNLTYNSNKAKEELNWNPTKVLNILDKI